MHNRCIFSADGPKGLFKKLKIMESKTKKADILLWIINYLRESKSELHKVTWPTKKEVTTYTMVVVVLCVVIAGFFGGFDLVLTRGLEKLIDLTS